MPQEDLRGTLKLLTIYDYNYIVARGRYSADQLGQNAPTHTNPDREISATYDSRYLDTRGRVFKFWINPSQLSIARRKLVTPILTKAGWEAIYWKDTNDMVILSYSGTSGACYDYAPDGTLLSVNEEGLLDVTRSQAWLKLKECEKFFTEATSNLTLVHDEGYFVGFFESFTVERSADQPYQVHYSFVFKGFPTKDDLIYETSFSNGGA